MFDKKQIEKLVKGMNLSEVVRPSDETIDELLSHGKTRILGFSTEQLDALSTQHFEFCWTQVGRFGFNNLNAVEIGYLAHIQPIYIAAAIYRYGMEWALKLLHMKRITAIHRNAFSVIKCRENYFSVYDLSRNLNAGHTNQNVSTVRSYVRSNDIEGLRAAVRDSDVSVCFLFAESPIFHVPTDDERKADEKPKRRRTPKGDYNPRHDGVNADI